MRTSHVSRRRASRDPNARSTSPCCPQSMSSPSSRSSDGLVDVHGTEPRANAGSDLRALDLYRALHNPGSIRVSDDLIDLTAMERGTRSSGSETDDRELPELRVVMPDGPTLVAGAGGFIGGHIIAQLLAHDVAVTAVDVKPLDEWHQVHGDAANMQLDLQEKNAARQAVSGTQAVF